MDLNPASTRQIAAGRWPAWLFGAVVLLGTFVLRASDPYLHNDHFFVISGARQVLHGELPFRDFFDEGRPLQHLISAGMLHLLGQNLLGETLLTVSSVALAAALTCLLSATASRSTWVGVMAATVVAFCPIRLQNHWKLSLPLLALTLFWGYSRFPTAGAAALLAGGVAAVFMYRHDYGVFVGLAAAMLLLAMHWRDGVRALVSRGLLCGSVFVAAVAPWLLFVATNGGVPEYLRQFSGYGQTAARLQPIPALLLARPAIELNWSAPPLVVHPPRPAPTPTVTVRWAQSVSPDTQRSLEQQYRLEPIEQRSEQAWRYQVADASAANLRSLVEDRRVADTDGIDRTRFELVELGREAVDARLRRQIPLLRADVLPGVLHAVNATAWLFYLFHALAGLGIVVALAKWLRARRCSAESRRASWALSAAVLLATLVVFIVRGDLELRVVEVLAPAMVVGALLVGGAGRGSTMSAWSGRFCAGLILFVTTISVALLGDVGRQIERSALFGGPSAVWHNLVRVLESTATTPSIDAWAPPGSVGGRALARYVYECTRPSDRLLVLGFASEAYFHSERLLGGSHFYYRDGFWTSKAEREQSLARLRQEPVPVILWAGDTFRIVADIFPELHGYVTTDYAVAQESTFGSDPRDVWRVLVRRDATPTGVYQPFGLPCFT